ncbi:hypothetical protein TNCV_146961 [Trichonephila clavipes]|nr:hypothetical protein TNCV_146961 [Trichonephila clavipes]
MSRAQLLQVLSQFEERYSAKKAQGSSKNYNRKRRYWDVRRKSSYDRRNRNWMHVEGLDRQNDRQTKYRIGLASANVSVKNKNSQTPGSRSAVHVFMRGSVHDHP